MNGSPQEAAARFTPTAYPGAMTSSNEPGQGRRDPWGLLSGGEGERRKQGIAIAIADILRVANFDTARALAREALAVLPELSCLDNARERLARTEGLIAELNNELKLNRQIEIDIYGADRKISSALGAQMQLAFQGMGSGPDGYTEGYHAGCDAFRQQVERRIAEIKNHGDDSEFHMPARRENLSCEP